MYTAQDVDARIAQMKADGASKAKIIDTASDMCIGWPYVFGAAGEMCTPDNRKKYAGYRPDKKPDIYGACPALNGTGTCDGCKWRGTRTFDCRGFTRWLLEQVGLTLYGGTVTAQWEYGPNWVYKGNIEKMPLSLVCCVFREGHTGMHLFGDVTRHCSKCVKEQLLPGVPKWQRFGIPAGMYTNEELRKAGLTVDESKNIPTLRRGSRGDIVKELQELLNTKYGAKLGVDGIYGAATEAEVKTFQQSKGLTADGICGPKTWKALGVNVSDTNVGDNARRIWDGLSLGINNPYAVAGIMGNLYAESSLIPNNLQSSGNKALGMTDAEYTAAVDNGAYTAESFVMDGFGYGLAQWTHNTRKAKLLNYATAVKKSIGDLEMQVQFLLQEIKGYSNVWPVLLKAKTVREASDAVLKHYEKPANQSEENQARRADLGQKYFDQFAASILEDCISISRLKAVELKALLVPLIQTAQKVLNEVETALNGGEGN